MNENEVKVSTGETKKLDNLIMLISGIIIAVGDVALYAGAFLGGFRFYNIPFDINNLIGLFTDLKSLLQLMTTGTGVGYVVITVMLGALMLGLTIRMIVVVFKLLKLFKLNADSEKARKNYSSYLRFAGGMYGLCGGTALGAVAINMELSRWGLVMIILTFAYIILMMLVELMLNFSTEGVATCLLRAFGTLVLCAVVVVVTLLYAKPRMATLSDLSSAIILRSGGFNFAEIVLNLFTWLDVLIAMVAGSMLSSVALSVTPIIRRKGKRSTGVGSFVSGFLFALLFLALKVVEVLVYDSSFDVVIGSVWTVAPLFVCSLAALVAIGGLIKRKKEMEDKKKE